MGHNKPNGGIERFKKGIHGKHLKYAAIIGYVQKEDFDYWFLQINDWIEELILSSPDYWQAEDKLIKQAGQASKQLAKFESNNIKIPAKTHIEKIRLFHFWISLV
ncbi:MAG: hypothetical protein GY816_16780 [Cytophagales bacterium]|nr:hypothetical protein [Cytophagales bacterium]